MKAYSEFVQGMFASFKMHRLEMPQIDEMEGFLNYLSDLNIIYTLLEEEEAGAYLPTQQDFDLSKVESIIESKSFDKPIIVSEENRVLDGHHRWMAASMSGNTLKVIKVYLPINQLLKHAYDYNDQ